MSSSIDRERALEKLCNVYREESQVGLILGAGVTTESGIPLYKEMALKLAELAARKMKNGGKASRKAVDFLVKQLKQGEKQDVVPEKVFQFIRNSLPEQDFLKLLWQAIYQNVPKAYKGRFPMLPSTVYRDNETLDSILCFCSASPGSRLASGTMGRWDTNKKVGGILTTNYDNLVEGSFNSKYRKILLKPVPGEKARESFSYKRVIPVYHMHGYVSYVEEPDKPDPERWGLVISEEDYYRTFYNLLGFSNVVAMSFLRRYSCIFIGCSMVDANIRRILYHLKREKIQSSEIKDHFAILPPRSQGEDDFDDALLESFGVTAIRVDNPDNIGSGVAAILKQIYLSLEGFNDERHWNVVKRGPKR